MAKLAGDEVGGGAHGPWWIAGLDFICGAPAPVEGLMPTVTCAFGKFIVGTV